MVSVKVHWKHRLLHRPTLVSIRMQSALMAVLFKHEKLLHNAFFFDIVKHRLADFFHRIYR